MFHSNNFKFIPGLHLFSNNFINSDAIIIGSAENFIPNVSEIIRDLQQSVRSFFSGISSKLNPISQAVQEHSYSIYDAGKKLYHSEAARKEALDFFKVYWRNLAYPLNPVHVVTLIEAKNSSPYILQAARYLTPYLTIMALYRMLERGVFSLLPIENYYGSLLIQAICFAASKSIQHVLRQGFSKSIDQLIYSLLVTFESEKDYPNNIHSKACEHHTGFIPVKTIIANLASIFYYFATVGFIYVIEKLAGVVSVPFDIIFTGYNYREYLFTKYCLDCRYQSDAQNNLAANSGIGSAFYFLKKLPRLSLRFFSGLDLPELEEVSADLLTQYFILLMYAMEKPSDTYRYNIDFFYPTRVIVNAFASEIAKHATKNGTPTNDLTVYKEWAKDVLESRWMRTLKWIIFYNSQLTFIEFLQQPVIRQFIKQRDEAMWRAVFDGIIEFRNSTKAQRINTVASYIPNFIFDYLSLYEQKRMRDVLAALMSERLNGVFEYASDTLDEARRITTTTDHQLLQQIAEHQELTPTPHTPTSTSNDKNKQNPTTASSANGIPPGNDNANINKLNPVSATPSNLGLFAGNSSIVTDFTRNDLEREKKEIEKHQKMFEDWTDLEEPEKEPKKNESNKPKTSQKNNSKSGIGSVTTLYNGVRHRHKTVTIPRDELKTTPRLHHNQNNNS